MTGLGTFNPLGNNVEEYFKALDAGVSGAGPITRFDASEFNTRFDYCHNCGFNGEVFVNENNMWECPNCGNTDTSKLTVVRRTCGYLGLHFWNEGKTREMKQRVLHL